MAQSNLANAVGGLSPESRLKLLCVADDLMMHIMQSGFPSVRTGPDGLGTPACEAATSVAGSVGGQASTAAAAVPLTPVEKTMILTPKLGVLRIEYDYTPAVGDIDHPASFAYEVEYETVAGLTFQKCQDGVLTDEIVEEFTRAVAVLHDKGCDVITGDCGFMFLFQDHTVINNHYKKTVHPLGGDVVPFFWIR